MLRLTLAAWLVSCLLPVAAESSDPPAPDVVSRLLGQWEGKGELFGRPATFSMAWERELDERFVRLTFENRMIENGESRKVLAAIAHYRIGESNSLRGGWFDTRGEILELSATANGSTLVTHWRSQREQGRTTYRVTEEDSVEVLDHVLGEDGWRPFGKAVYRRQAPSRPDPGF